jgi:hypothetical protein
MTFWDEDRYRNNEILPSVSDGAGVYLARYKRIGMNVFKWDGLPDGVISQDLEFMLLNGGGMIYDSAEIGITLARADIKGYSVTNRPMTMSPTMLNRQGAFSTFKKPTLTDGVDCVYLHDLADWRKGRIDYIRDARICEQMAEIDIAIKQQIINQRAPIVFGLEGPTSGGGVKGKAFVQSLLNGVNAYMFSGGVETAISTLKLDSPFNVETLLNIRKTYFNEGLELMGVNNEPGMQKRERMNNIEVTANDELLNVYLYDAFSTREMIAEKINAVFGSDTTVEIIDTVRISEEPEYNDDEGDGDEYEN